jgi:hypothetical protein
VVDADLAEGVEQPLRQASGVALAVAGREAVPGVATAVGDVEIGDVADADDAASR